MRHRVAGTKFNVDKDHRKMLLKNLLTDLVKHEKITTTEAKAKALKSLFDRVVTKAKKNGIAARRNVSKMVIDHATSVKLFDVLLPKLSGRTSGYTTTERLSNRPGDRASMMTISILADASEMKEKGK